MEKPLVDAYEKLAEAVIKLAKKDMKSKNTQRQYSACRFFMDNFSMDLYTGLAPDKMLEWERTRKTATEIFNREYITKEQK